MSSVGISVVLLALSHRAVADGDTSTSTSPYLSTNGSLGAPVFGTFASLDNGLRPVAAYALEIGGVALQFVSDSARKVELTDPTSYTRAASTDIGIRVSAFGIASSASAKEGYLIAACGDGEPHPLKADCEGDPRAALTKGVSVSLGGRMTLGPDHIYRGLAVETIATVSARPFLAYAALTARKENKENGTDTLMYMGLHEYSASGGASIRALSSSAGGGAYLEVGVVGRMLWFEADDSEVRHTLAEVALALQLRFSALDLVARFAWERHDTITSQLVTSQPVSWIFALQPTVFF